MGRRDTHVDRKAAGPIVLIDRRLPEAGTLSAEDLRSITRTWNAVLDDMRRGGVACDWVQSFITEDAIYCVHMAPDPETVREMTRRSGLSAHRVMDVRAVIDRTTTE
jgi:hypothetical protein